MWFRAVLDVVEEVGGAKASVVEATRRMVTRFLMVMVVVECRRLLQAQVQGAGRRARGAGLVSD